MNLYEACTLLGVWAQAKANAEVWALSNTPAQDLLPGIYNAAKTRYRILACKYHPDVGGDDVEFIRIKTALDIIKSASTNKFISALEDEKRTKVKLFVPGSENCYACEKWNNILTICITTSCSGFSETKLRYIKAFRGDHNANP